MSKAKKIIVPIVLLLGVIQFIPHEREYITINTAADFRPENATEVMSILKTACYDCHSYETQYPWYANVVPLNYWIDHHVEEGREHLNFSEWNTYPVRDQQHAAEETVEVVAEKEMPMLFYWMIHWDAKLTDAQRQTLVDYFGQLSGGEGAHHGEHDEDDD